jgi:hypothetical protein
VVKVREGLAHEDYKDPGPYPHPAGTVAYEFTGTAAEAPRHSEMPSTRAPAVEFDVIKPGSKPSPSHQH